MSGYSAERSLPPSDRDDAPTFPQLEAEAAAPDAPPLTDETDAARLRRLARHLGEGVQFSLEAQTALSERNFPRYRACITRAAEHLTDAASLAGRLSDPRTARAIPKE